MKTMHSSIKTLLITLALMAIALPAAAQIKTYQGNGGVTTTYDMSPGGAVYHTYPGNLPGSSTTYSDRGGASWNTYPNNGGGSTTYQTGGAPGTPPPPPSIFGPNASAYYNGTYNKRK